MKTNLLVVVAVMGTSALVAWAADEKQAVQRVVELKADGSVVGELRVYSADHFSVEAEDAEYTQLTKTTKANDVTLRFGGKAGKSITVKAEEIEMRQPDQSTESHAFDVGAGLIEPGKPITCFDGYVLHVEERNGSFVEGVRLVFESGPTVLADRGFIGRGPSRDSLVLGLLDARSKLDGRGVVGGDMEVLLKR